MDAERYAEPEDIGLYARVEDQVTSSVQGTGDAQTTWKVAGIQGWTAVAQPFIDARTPEGAEFAVALSLVSEVCGASFGLAVYHH